MSATSLSPNIAEIRRAVEILFAENQTVELRAVGTHKGNCAGFYRDRDKLAAHAAKISENLSTPAVYWTLQHIDPELFSRAPDRFQTHVKQGFATGDANVLRYRWLPVDCDPQRNPTKISSTNAEKADALEVATAIRDDFDVINGWDGYASILADSGNGYHVLLPTDLEVSDESKRLCARVLQALDQQFSTGDEASGTKIDTTVFNPSRICKVYGTVVRKGPNTAERPHRMAHLLDVPDDLRVVPLEVLENIAAKFKPSQAEISTASANNQSSNSPSRETLEAQALKMEQFLAEAKCAHRRRMDYDNGGYKWQLEECPFNPEHKAPDSYAFIKVDGKLGFHCSHNHCVQNKWDQFRAKAEAVIGHRFRFVEPSSRPSNVGDYTRVGESRKFETYKGVHPILAKARAAALLFDKEELVFDPKAKRKVYEPILDGLLVVGDSALFIGAKKTEKSLFSMRIGMHIACGKDWCGYKCPKSRKVSYLDAENGEVVIGDRYDEMMKEFSVEEQELIRANFKIVDGRKWRDAGGSLDYLNDDFWDWYAKKSTEAEIHILDCLYMFHNKDPKDNIGMLEVLSVLRYRLADASSGKTMIMLNHTRSLSNDDFEESQQLVA